MDGHTQAFGKRGGEGWTRTNDFFLLALSSCRIYMIYIYIILYFYVKKRAWYAWTLLTKQEKTVSLFKSFDRQTNRQLDKYVCWQSDKQINRQIDQRIEFCDMKLYRWVLTKMERSLHTQLNELLSEWVTKWEVNWCSCYHGTYIRW